MHRIFILSLLAIVFSTFALESTQVILRATEIRGDALVVEWSPIDWAKTYKVLYDEQSLINPKAPEPILESASTDKTRMEINKMTEGVEYYLIVQWFDAKGVKVGETLPLHASTFLVPIFALKESKVIDDQNLTLSFSQPIDIKKTQIEIMNSETKKARTIKSMTSSSEDLRIVNIILEGKLEPNISHDVVLKKVTNTTGVEMSPELKKTSTITFIEKATSPVEDDMMADTIAPEKSTPDTDAPSADLWIPPVPTQPVVVETQKDPTPDSSQSILEPQKIVEALEPTPAPIITKDPEEVQKKPVSIDKLPQTGPSVFLMLGLAVMLWITLSHKKKTSL